MEALQEQVAAFLDRKENRAAEARQSAAFFLISGIDLDRALEMPDAEKAVVLARVGRLMRRERLKGMKRHWSYDLNRHIALKQAYDRLKRSRAAPAVQ